MVYDQQGERRFRAGRWLLIGIAVVLAAGVAVTVGRGDDGPVVAGPTSTPTASVSPRPDCAPEITSTWLDTADTKYGFVYRGQCDQAVQDLRFLVTVRDQSGADLSGKDTIVGGVLFPDGELAAAGYLQGSKREKNGSLHVKVTNFTAYPPEDFSGWAQIEVTGLSQAPDRFDRSVVTGTVEAKPSSRPICVHEFVLIMKDKTDTIIYAHTSQTQTLRPQFSVSPLSGLDFARTKIYAPQTPWTAGPPRDGMSCTGSSG